MYFEINLTECQHMYQKLAFSQAPHAFHDETHHGTPATFSTLVRADPLAYDHSEKHQERLASTKEYRSSILPPTTLDWFKKYNCDFGQPSVLQISQKSRLSRLQLIAYTASPLIKGNRGVEIYKTRLRQEPKNQIAIKYSAKPSKVIQSPNGQDSSTPIRFKFFRYACPMT